MFLSLLCSASVRQPSHEKEVPVLATDSPEKDLHGTGHPRSVHRWYRTRPASTRFSWGIPHFYQEGIRVEKTAASATNGPDMSVAGNSSASSQDDSAGPSAPTTSQPSSQVQHTPPDQMIGNLGIIIDEAPRVPRQPRGRDPPDLQTWSLSKLRYWREWWRNSERVKPSQLHLWTTQQNLLRILPSIGKG